MAAKSTKNWINVKVSKKRIFKDAVDKKLYKNTTVYLSGDIINRIDRILYEKHFCFFSRSEFVRSAIESFLYEFLKNSNESELNAKMLEKLNKFVHEKNLF